MIISESETKQHKDPFLIGFPAHEYVFQLLLAFPQQLHFLFMYYGSSSLENLNLIFGVESFDNNLLFMMITCNEFRGCLLSSNFTHL